MEKEFLLDAYSRIMKIRLFDMRMHEINKDENERKKLMGIMHSHIGAEAYSVAVSMCMKDDDYMGTTYRNHAHTIAKGMSLKGLAAEMYGKETGVCKGNGGNMHAVDQDLNIVAGFGIIGAGLPAMLGTAFASKYRKTDEISVVYFGDGAIPQGAFHESMNLAAKWNLPVLFVNDNNGYAMSTNWKNNLCHEDTTEYAKAYNMPAKSSCGMDFFKAYEVAKEGVEHVRSGKGPYYLEFKNYRFHGQWEGDPQNYKPQEEVDYYWDNEPVKLFRERVLNEGWLAEEELNLVDESVKSEVTEAYKFAEESPFADADHMYKYVYADKY